VNALDVVVRSSLALQCRRCGNEPFLAAEFPDSAAVDGCTSVALCPCCDATAPAAQPLLAWFEIHVAVREDTVEQFAALVRVWLEDVAPAGLSDEVIAAAVAAWSTAS
jgi:hypothetical protein